MNYDLYIKEESYNTEFFIHDVESILLKLEENPIRRIKTTGNTRYNGFGQLA